jgi:DNA-binding CsgD family transcriptional regulator
VKGDGQQVGRSQRSSVAAIGSRPAAGPPDLEAQWTRPALDSALGAILEPTVVVGRNGEILQANAPAEHLLLQDPPGVRRLLVEMASGVPGDKGWHLKPFQATAEPSGFLAILRSPSLEPETVLAGRVASLGWKVTARQREVLTLVANGLTNAIIAETLGIKERTVEFHLSGLFDKAGVDNRATLIAKILGI